MQTALLYYTEMIRRLKHITVIIIICALTSCKILVYIIIQTVYLQIKVNITLIYCQYHFNFLHHLLSAEVLFTVIDTYTFCVII